MKRVFGAAALITALAMAACSNAGLQADFAAQAEREAEARTAARSKSGDCGKRIHLPIFCHSTAKKTL
ncbi:hypothetical protein [Treponema endosymbiont of Eucomonympha sp.]|uniref:hypothetical protein n=1 Tax=Treponema endosymbiont of Eucomonympha sp. TaxID=1580831 RepID=UPI001396AB42|nr:hypothetical protein [Treponema endosymbiont of Eucomonympha sp.]